MDGTRGGFFVVPVGDRWGAALSPPRGHTNHHLQRQRRLLCVHVRASASQQQLAAHDALPRLLVTLAEASELADYESTVTNCAQAFFKLSKVGVCVFSR